jgi:GAF domain-containing protein
VRPDRGDDLVRVAEMFASVARLLAGDRGSEPVVDRILRLAVEHLDACDAAGMSIVEGRRIVSAAATHEIPQIVDAIQVEVDEGPCLDAIREHAVFRTGDLAAEARWPRFSARAEAETGVRSILAVRLFVDEHTFGALNLYSTRPDAFADDVDVALASVFAAHAAVAMLSGRRQDQLARMAESRDVIGRAKGILMAQSHVDDDGAFDLLRRASQRLNVKLVDVARRVAGEGGEGEDGGGEDGGRPT